MRLSDLTYKIYRGSSGASSFWRWELLAKGKGVRSLPLKSGVLYGTMADAKQRASAELIKLAQSRNSRPEPKT
jgi:hypothetical protein